MFETFLKEMSSFKKNPPPSLPEKPPNQTYLRQQTQESLKGENTV